MTFRQSFPAPCASRPNTSSPPSTARSYRSRPTRFPSMATRRTPWRPQPPLERASNQLGSTYGASHLSSFDHPLHGGERPLNRLTADPVDDRARHRLHHPGDVTSQREREKVHLDVSADLPIPPIRIEAPEKPA